MLNFIKLNRATPNKVNLNRADKEELVNQILYFYKDGHDREYFDDIVVDMVSKYGAEHAFILDYIFLPDDLSIKTIAIIIYKIPKSNFEKVIKRFGITEWKDCPTRLTEFLNQ